jgi:hypothetical protein
MTELEKELAEALVDLIDAVNAIRGIVIEEYMPNEYRQAYEVLSKCKEKP